MRSSRPRSGSVLAPGAASSGTARAPGQGEPLPAVDERRVHPETREEMIDGRIVQVAPANDPNAVATSDLAALLTTHVKSGYRAAVDMLIRTDAQNDFAPDASVFPDGREPLTGGRQLERLAFEICDTQTRARAAGKASKLSGRGVARVFCIERVGCVARSQSRRRDRRRVLGKAAGCCCSLGHRRTGQ